MSMKVFIHERSDERSCQFGWAENDTQAPNQVRHECDEESSHLSYKPHICSCGLVEDE